MRENNKNSFIREKALTHFVSLKYAHIQLNISFAANK